jgi:hypothetical protein
MAPDVAPRLPASARENDITSQASSRPWLLCRTADSRKIAASRDGGVSDEKATASMTKANDCGGAYVTWSVTLQAPISPVISASDEQAIFLRASSVRCPQPANGSGGHSFNGDRTAGHRRTEASQLRGFPIHVNRQLSGKSRSRKDRSRRKFHCTREREPMINKATSACQYTSCAVDFTGLAAEPPPSRPAIPML